MPMVKPSCTSATITPCDIGAYLFHSDIFEGKREIRVGQTSTSTGTWSDYPIGVLDHLPKLGIEPPTFKLSVIGNVPLDAGLSSSASVEIASAMEMLSTLGKTLGEAELTPDGRSRRRRRSQ